MNNVMLGVVLGVPEVLVILLVVLLGLVIPGGIIVLVLWLVRREKTRTPVNPPVQQPEQPKPAPSTCPRCGTVLPADSPQGLCPRCVLGVGLATQTEATGEFGPHGTKVTKPPPAPADIAKHFPQLEILGCLGRGGMGVVYKARQPKLNRLVALKILAPEKGADPKFAQRFLREAQALARLSHPNIVTVHDFGEAEGMFYLLMEYVDGATLRQLLREGRMKPEQALVIVPKICEALQFAHEQGVVHRDIKPENVLLDKQGRVKIADFGIAKIVAEAGRAGSPLPAGAAQPEGGAHPAGAGRTATALTQDQVIGTPHYMAPEQVEHPQTVDHRADIYSLGVVFYEMLTGELPLGKFQPPSKKVQVDVRLDEVVLHTLEKEPERRYQHASEVKADVETISSTTAPPPSNSEAFAREILARDYVLEIRSCLRRGWALVRSNFWPLAGITALVLVLLAVAHSFTVVISSETARSSGSASLLGLLLTGPLLGGLYLYFLRKIRQETATVETAFSGFSNRFLHLFLGGFVTLLLTGLGFVCLILPGIYLLVAWIFTLPLIIDKRLDFWSAMELSRKTVSKHWWKFLGFGIVLLLCKLAGLLACGVGIFVMYPIALAALMYAYEDIFNPPGLPPAPRAQAGVRGWHPREKGGSVVTVEKATDEMKEH